VGGGKALKLCGDGVGRLLERHGVRFQLVSDVSEATQPEPPRPLP